MIHIGKVEMQNFMMIGKASVDFANRGLLAILGPNGSGKSSLVVESLNYPLFGITERYGVERDRIVNRFVGKDCHIHVPLTIDEMVVVIDAYRKHSRFKDEIFLTVDGVDKRGRTNAHTWDKIGQLLDMDAVGWQNSIVFGQSMSQYAGLTDAQQKAIVERMLGCSWIPKSYELATADKDAVSNEMDGLADKFDTLGERIKKIKEDIFLYEGKRDNFETDRAKRIKAVDVMQQTKDTKVLTEEVEVLKQKLENSALLLEEKAGLEKTIRTSTINLTELRSDLSHLLKDISNITDKMKSAKETVSETTCDSCGQTITPLSKEGHLKHLQKDKEVKAAEVKVAQIQIEAKEKELKPSQDKYNVLLQLEKENKSVNQIFQNKQTELSKSSRENAVIQERNERIQQQVEGIKTETNTYQEVITKLQSELVPMTEEQKTLREGYKSLEVGFPYQEFMAEFFSNRGLKSYLIESVLPAMNVFSDIYSRALGGKYSITFSPQKSLKKGEMREKFNVSVINDVGADVYEGNSNGEKRAIDAIVLFVMGELAASRFHKKVSALILDDVFEKLDSLVCRSIVKVLKTMVIPKENRSGEDSLALPERESIFVLTHLESLKDQFENKIKVGRDQNGQTLIDGD